MIRLVSWLWFTICLLFAFTSHAITIRYALILGNNVGVDTDGSEPFTPLMHAEREAQQLKDKLVKFSNFDPSEKRTRLLTGAAKEEIRSAVRALIKEKESDRKAFGKIDTLFLVYFSGHGLDGRLLLRDDALFADEIGTYFTDFGADFSIGIFDSCYAGSLDTAALAAKGIHSAPGLNLFRELPEEVLSAEGSIWYVSSSREQESYEDERLGGVFTHFFIEALEKADKNGPGITLENIWQYARSNTVEYTADRKRKQVPEQFIAKLRSNAPIYFSFPMARSATIVFSDSLEGRFVLAYEKGNLTEVFEKKLGEEQKLAVYPGNARLILVDADRNTTSRAINLKPKSTIHLATMTDERPECHLGERRKTLFEKGLGIKTSVTATQIKPGIALIGGVGYSFSMTHQHLLNARNKINLPFRLYQKKVFWGVDLQYGYGREEFSVWGYIVHEVGGKVMAGYALDYRRFRYSVAGAFGFTYLRQIYDTGGKRWGMQYRPMLEVGALFPTNTRFHGELFADVGAVSAPGIGRGVDNTWQWYVAFGGSIYFRIL